MRLRIDLDPETTQRLIHMAVSERRPIAWHAEVLLRRALGLPFPEQHPGQEGREVPPCGSQA